MTACTRAPKLANLAVANGWEAKLTQVNEVVDRSYDSGLVSSSPEPGHVDLEVSTTWRHPDTDEGWVIGIAVRWYAQRGRNGRVSWRLAELDGKPGRTVGGVAQRLKPARVLVQDGYGGRYVDRPVELELWLGGLKVLERYLVDPADLVAWLDEQAQEGANA